jgi:hypothetical protein
MSGLNISNINKDVKVLEKYLTTEKKGEDANKRVYLQVMGDHLEVTGDKTKRATESQISDYVKSLKINLANDIKVNGITSKKMDVANHLNQVYNLFVKNVKHEFTADFSEDKIIDINSYIIKIDKNNPFYGLDLMVLSDDYKGVIPLNCVTQKEFSEMTTLLHSLKDSNKYGSLVIATEDEHVKNEFIDMIAMLCTRKVGREIVDGIVKLDREITLHSSKKEELYFNSETYEISINPDILVQTHVMDGLSEDLSDDDAQTAIYTPLYLILGHEMVHALHHSKDSVKYEGKFETKIEDLSNLEEQQTILGWDNKDYKPKTLSSELNEKMEESEDWDQFLAENQVDLADDYFGWEKLSENGLRSVFGIQPRVDHLGDQTTNTKMALELRKNIFEIIAKADTKSEDDFFIGMDETFSPEVVEIISKMYGWENFLNDAAQVALKNKSWDFVLYFVEKGAEKPSLEEWGNDLNEGLIMALHQKDPKDVEALLLLGANPDLIEMPLPERIKELENILMKKFEKTENTLKGWVNLRARQWLNEDYKPIVSSSEDWGDFTDKICNQLKDQNKDILAKKFSELVNNSNNRRNIRQK